ncbi:MAG: SPOR domain-containing protein [Bacteroidales bacterium]|nr:SPOR domain-containing protein [Bacteroidales bacterium]
MKRTLLTLLLLVVATASLRAQGDTLSWEVVDSVIYIPAARVDTSLVGKDIFMILPDGKNGTGRVSVSQSESVSQSAASRIESNKQRSIEGYRVRIFFKESARAESEEVQRLFMARYPGVSAYRSYANPYFKVTVGDFRTRSEAMQLMKKLQNDYPTAFVVKEPIRYPVVDKTQAYLTDTIQVRKPKTPAVYR